MNLQEQHNFKGILTIQKLDANNNIVEEEVVENMIMNAGKAVMAGLGFDVDSQAAFTDLQMGTGTTANVATMTTLTTPITDTSMARKTATRTRVTTTTTNDSTELYALWTNEESGDYAVTECGIFNSANIMFSRQVFGVKTIEPNSKIAIYYKIVML